MDIDSIGQAIVDAPKLKVRSNVGGHESNEPCKFNGLAIDEEDVVGRRLRIVTGDLVSCSKSR